LVSARIDGGGPEARPWSGSSCKGPDAGPWAKRSRQRLDEFVQRWRIRSCALAKHIANPEKTSGPIIRRAAVSLWRSAARTHQPRLAQPHATTHQTKRGPPIEGRLAAPFGSATFGIHPKARNCEMIRASSSRRALSFAPVCVSISSSRSWARQ